MTSFRLRGLDPAPFAPLFALDDAALQARGARRLVVDATPGYPDRIELRDLDPGERAILVNYVHLETDSPYRAFDGAGMLVGAEVTDGRAFEAAALRLLADPAAAYVHVHYAAPGCYAARADRV